MSKLRESAEATAPKVPRAESVAVEAAKQDKAAAEALHRLGESKEGPIGDDAYMGTWEVPPILQNGFSDLSRLWLPLMVVW